MRQNYWQAWALALLLTALILAGGLGQAAADEAGGNLTLEKQKAKPENQNYQRPSALTLSLNSLGVTKCQATRPWDRATATKSSRSSR